MRQTKIVGPGPQLWLVAGTAAISIAATIAVFRGGWPPAVIPRVAVPPIADTIWSAGWSAAAHTPAETQAGALTTLVRIIVALAGASFALALLNVFALLAVQRLRQRRSDAIRVALGATRKILFRARWQENRRGLVAGAFVAIAISAGLIALLYATWPDGLIAPAQRFPVAAMGATTAFLLVLALINALRASRPPNPALELAGGTATSSRRRVRENAFITVSQIGLAVALTTAALLLYRHGRVDAERMSYDAGGLISAELRFTEPLAPAESAAAYAALLARTASSPNVTDGAIASPGTWLGIGTRDRILFECGACVVGGMYLPLQMRMVSHHAVSPGFFRSLDMDIVQGREFDSNDVLGAEHVALVNHTFASTAFESGNAVGKKVQLGGLRGEWFTVVGIVQDIHGSGIGAARADLPAVFVPLLQMPTTEATLTVRAVADVTSVNDFASLLPSQSEGIVVHTVAALNDRLAAAVAPVRWAGTILAGLGIVALLLSLHGVHSSLDAQVQNRARELAVRAAFGASPAKLARHVLGRSFRLLACGIGMGFVLAFVAARFVEARIGGIPVLDAAPVVAAAFAVTALGGAVFAVRRAARTQPARALSDY